MKDNVIKLLLIAFFLFLAGCATQKIYYYSADPMLPGTSRDMKTAGFWLSRHPCPDRVILTAGEIGRLNASIVNQKSVKDLLRLTADPVVPGKEIGANILEIHNSLKTQEFFFTDARPVTAAFFDTILAGYALGSIPQEQEVAFGFLRHFSPLRSLPVNTFLTMTKGEFYFDELQMSGMDPGTPLVVLHQTSDGQWLFVNAPEANGWIEAGQINLCTKEEFAAYLANPSFVVVTAAKADIFLDEKLSQYYDYARMGTRLVESELVNDSLVKILLPVAGEQGQFTQTAYVQRKDVNEGYLAYTPRHILQQAFTLLNAPYGWGDMFGEQDCSRFIWQVFATAGIMLPRNSAWQAQAGLKVLDFPKAATAAERSRIIKEQAIPGVSLLRLSGHIMLYAGFFDEKPYVIHSIWAYKEKIGGTDQVLLINRTAVTDLELGKTSARGSLLTRLLSINDLVLERL